MPEGQNQSSEMAVRPVFLVDQSVYESYASYIRRILVGLAGTAHASALVCPGRVDTKAILCPSVEHFEHPVLRLPVFKSQNRKILLDRLSRFKPSVIHAFYPTQSQMHLARWLGDQLQVPFVATLHRTPKGFLSCDKLLSKTARIIAPSEQVANQLEKKRPDLKDRIDRIHVGCFVEDTCSCFSHEADIASMVVMHPLKNFKLFEPLLNAIRHLVLDGFELMVAVMGTGSAEKTIRRKIRDLGLTSVVTVLPEMRPVRSIFAGADIYLHLEDRKRFDAQLLEAMGVGLAIAGAPDQSSGLLLEGQTAAFWDTHDELSIYACLKKLLGQRDRTRQLAHNAQSHLRAHHSVSRMVEKLMKTYTQAQVQHKENVKQPEEEPISVG
jgi:glycosyltransferase involved in cell wall biosynthesis